VENFHQDVKLDDLFTWVQTPGQALSTKDVSLCAGGEPVTVEMVKWTIGI